MNKEKEFRLERICRLNRVVVDSVAFGFYALMNGDIETTKELALKAADSIDLLMRERHLLPKARAYRISQGPSGFSEMRLFDDPDGMILRVAGLLRLVCKMAAGQQIADLDIVTASARRIYAQAGAGV